MNTRMREFVVGLTAVVGLLGLAFMLLMFGEFAKATVKRYPLYLEMPNAGGLKQAAHVMLNGVKIGQVSGARTADDPRQGVVLALEIDQGIRVPRDVDVSVASDFVGDTRLVFNATPNSTGPDKGFFDANETFSAKGGGTLDQITGMLDKRLASLEDAVNDFRKLSATYTRVGERIETYLAPRTPEQVDQEGAEPNLASTLRRLDTAIASANQWVGDKELLGDARSVANRAANVMERVSAAVDGWTTAASALSRNADRLGEGVDDALHQFAQTTKNLNDTLIEVQGITAQVNSGKGTIGLLLTNPDLYRSLDDAAKRLEKALTEAQLLLEKYRKEGIPIQF